MDFEQESAQFDIADKAIVFDILRSKLYTDPISAVVREYVCNARDANREVGKGDVPIVVEFPTNTQHCLKISDSGPGISPDRMFDIFIKYAATTKRNAQNQTGSFGIGAKSAFAISDQFTIDTIFNGMKYSYLAFLDETKIGKMELLSKKPTEENNGTTISIEINYKDLWLYHNALKKACYFWEVKPKIVGFSNYFTINNIDTIPLTDNCKISFVPGIGHNNDGISSISVVMDDICYNISQSHLIAQQFTNLYSAKGSYNDFVNNVIRNHKIAIHLPNRSIPVSANREQIHLDEKSINTICAKLAETEKFLIDKFQSEIDKCDTFDQLNQWSNENYVKYLSPFKLKWKGLPLNYTYNNIVKTINFNIYVDEYICNKSSYKYSHKLFEIVLSNEKNHPNYPETIIINDYEIDESFNPKNIATKLRKKFVIQNNSGEVIYDYSNRYRLILDKNGQLKNALNKCNIPYAKLSSLYKHKSIDVKSKIRFYKLERESWFNVAISSLDPNKETIIASFEPQNNYRYINGFRSLPFPVRELSLLNKQIIAVADTDNFLKRAKEMFPKHILLDATFAESIVSKQELLVISKYLCRYKNELDQMLQILPAIKDHRVIQNKLEMIQQYEEQTNSLTDLEKCFRNSSHLYNKERDIENIFNIRKVFEELKTDFPMLFFIFSFKDIDRTEETKKIVQNYIDLVLKNQSLNSKTDNDPSSSLP